MKRFERKLAELYPDKTGFAEKFKEYPNGFTPLDVTPAERQMLVNAMINCCMDYIDEFVSLMNNEKCGLTEQVIRLAALGALYRQTKAVFESSCGSGMVRLAQSYENKVCEILGEMRKNSSDPTRNN